MQIAVELLSQADVWMLEIARNPVFSRTKWLQASVGGTSSVRRVRFAFVVPILSALHGGDL